MHKRSIIPQAIKIGNWTLISRLLGLMREILMARYLGAGIIADAFFTAFKIPNSLRKIFAEGALSAALIPTLVKVEKKEGKEEMGRLMSLSFLFFEGILMALCLLIFWKAATVIRIIAPGWFQKEFMPLTSWQSFFHMIYLSLHWAEPLPQAVYAITYVRILIAFIIFISSSALLAGALQSVHHFFVPAFAPVLLNIFFIAGLVFGLLFELPVDYLCYFILCGGLAQFLLHVYMYFKLSFSFNAIDSRAWRYFREILKKFLPCLLSMSVMEINLFISTSLATYLPAGSVSLIYYTNRFMGIPLGVFVASLSTVLLPFFSRIGTYAPRRLSFYLLETAKLIFWVTVPLSLVMSFLSEKIFITLFASKNFTIAHAVEAHYLLIIFLSGLFFFALNKIMLNMYYALHDTRIPTIISIIATVTNYCVSKLTLPFLGTLGLALAITIAGIVQTALSALFLYHYYEFKLYFRRFYEFFVHACMQIIMAFIVFLISYYVLLFIIQHSVPARFSYYVLEKIWFWIWAGPLALGFFVLLFKTRKMCNIHLYLLD